MARERKESWKVCGFYTQCVFVCSYAVSPHRHTVNGPLLKDVLTVSSFLALLYRRIKKSLSQGMPQLIIY